MSEESAMTEEEVAAFEAKIRAREHNTLVFEYALVCILIGRRTATPRQREEKVLMEQEVIRRMYAGTRTAG